MEEIIVELSQKVIKNIEEIVQSVVNYSQHQSQIEIQTLGNEEIEKNKFKTKESYFDKLHEMYSRCSLVCKQEIIFKKLFEEFLFRIEAYFLECKNKKEQLGDQLNVLLDELKQMEKDIQGNLYSEEFEEVNYSGYYSNT